MDAGRILKKNLKNEDLRTSDTEQERQVDANHLRKG